MAKKKKNQQKKQQQYTMPPYLTFDPSIDAEKRAQERGLSDILADTDQAESYAGEDLAQRQSDLNLGRERGMADIGRRQARGTEDINLRQKRGTEDFSTSLNNLIRGFQVKAREQTQVANQAGSLDNATSRAAAARRAEGLAQARHPIDVGIQRLGEDTTRSLGRLTEDSDLARQRLGEDTDRDLSLAGTDQGRTLTELATKRRRAIREQRIGAVDLTQQAIFQARQAKPGYFTQFGTPKNKKRKRR